MADRQRGGLNGAIRGGTLLDTLVVKIDVDLSGFQRGIAQAIAAIRTLKGAIASQVGGVSLSDAMTAALVAPVVVATARLGQMRNEVRALTQEMRGVGLLTHGAGAPGRSAGAVAPYTGGMVVVPPVLNAQRDSTLARDAGGRWRRSYSVESDDLADAARGPASTGSSGGRGPRPPGPFAGVTGWFGGLYGRESARTAGAFESGRQNFPGYADATDNLGASAHRTGAAGRRMAGGRIASMLGLVGLGALFGDLLALAASLATVIGGTLAGAFSALMTPLGAVVALVTALAALFVASNWDQFREFGEWFAERWRDIVAGEGMGDIIAGWNNLKDAVGELWAAIRVAFHDDSNSIGAVLRFFGEVVLRVVNSVMELLGGLLNTIAELVRAVAALIRGDWEAAWGHFGAAVEHAFRAVLDTLGSLFPDIQAELTSISDWVVDRFEEMGNAAASFWQGLTSGSSREPLVNRYSKSNRSGGKSGAANDNGALANPEGVVLNDGFLERLERGQRLADGFASSLMRAFDNGATSGMKFGDVLKQVVAELIVMALRIRLLEPLTQRLGQGLSGLFGGMFGGGKGGGGGGFFGAIGSLFSGFFADGGFIPPGQWGVVGERGPEIAFGGRSGKTIHPMGGVNDNMRIDARAFIDARGADPAAIARLQQALARRDAELPMKVRAYVGDMRQRGRLA